MSQIEITARLQGYNRDLIRRAAKAAGVVNVSYKSKSENIEAMIALGVLDVTESGEPVRTIQVVHDAAEAARQERAETEEPAEPTEEAATEEVPIGERTTEDLEAELNRLLAGNVTVGLADRIEIISDELAARDMEDEYDPADDDEVVEETCPACGDPIDYCQGHGEIGDPEGFKILQAEADDYEGPEYPDREGDVLDDDEPEPDPLAGVTYSLAMDAQGNSVLSIVVDGEMTVVSESAALYTRLVTALLAREDPRPLLGDPIETIAAWAAEALSDRVVLERTESGLTRLLIDGEEVHGKVVDQFVRYWLEGRDPTNLLRFLERVASNPLTVAEHNLYGWDSALTIDTDGYFIGFKAVFPADVVDGVQRYQPSRSGPGEVNGVKPEDGWLKMKVGDVVTMDRDLVLPGPECGVGLHVGTHSYASTFSARDRVVMEVRVDPADIVNVPSRETGKLRCCRFEVLAFHTKDGRVDHYEPEATWDEETAVAKVEDVFEDQPAEALGFFRRIFNRKKG